MAGPQASPPISSPELALDPRWQAVQRVVHSKSFSRSTRLSSFLLYVTERALRGRPEEVTEQQVGMNVFGRAAGYNPSEDNIVRSTARQLRERLALYYQEEGLADDLRIVLVRGGYLPRFESATALPTAAPEIPAPPAPELPAPTSATRRSAEWLRLAGASLLAVLVTVALTRLPFRSPQSALWHTLFDGHRSTILVPGDSGTVMFQNLTGREVHVSDYASGDFRSAALASPKAPPATVEDIGARRYTSFSDLKFASRLSRVPALIHEQFEIRFARDLHVDDLKHSNLILVGAPQGNPWVELFDKELNFTITSNEISRSLTVLNRAPQPGEKSNYTYSVYDPSHRAFALIAFTSNLDRSGVALVVQGTTVAGIDAATEFLFNDAAMRPILAEAADGHGGIRRFEVLLETGNIAASGINTTVRAKRFSSF